MENRDGIGSRGLKTKLIVNYLPQSMSDIQFRELFASIGRVDSYRVMRDKQTNYCFGYGFIDFISPEDAQLAIEKLNGYRIENKTLRVAYSKPPGSSKNVNLHVTGLATTVDENKLKELFGVYGEVVSAKVLRDNAGESRGAGFVLFREKPQADDAVKNLQGYSDGYGTKLEIKYAKEAGDQQKTHPKFKQYLQQNNMPIPNQAHQVPSYMQHIQHHPPAANDYYNHQPFYGSNQNVVSQGPMRGRPQGQRFNPIARPVSNNGVPISEEGSSVLFVYNIGNNPTEADVYGLFSRFGRITKVDLTTKGFVFVHMPIPGEAQEAIRAVNGTIYNGRQLQVSLKK